MKIAVVSPGRSHLLDKMCIRDRRYAELQATYSGPIKLHLASENMLDNLFEERLETVSYTHLDVYKRQVYTLYFQLYDKMDSERKKPRESTKFLLEKD